MIGFTAAWWSEAVRRVLDCVVALAVLVCASPLLAIAALAITATDGRPVIFRRRVLGRDGVEFDALKLRTMRRNAEAVLEADPGLRAVYAERLKLRRDPRVTPVGRLLRRLSVDELPQLLNVLAGDMTLVGPRMIHPGEYARFGDLGPVLLALKPGLTGLWQVSGRQDLDFRDRLRLDAEYVRRRSLRFDIWILTRTLPAVVGGRGAY